MVLSLARGSGKETRTLEFWGMMFAERRKGLRIAGWEVLCQVCCSKELAIVRSARPAYRS